MNYSFIHQKRILESISQIENKNLREVRWVTWDYGEPRLKPCLTTEPSTFFSYLNLAIEFHQVDIQITQFTQTKGFLKTYFLLTILTFLSISDHKAETNGSFMFKKKCTLVKKKKKRHSSCTQIDGSGDYVFSTPVGRFSH